MAVRDFTFALRLFAAQRAFFVTTVLTIALGVGLSATVFAIVDGVLFRGLPYRDASRLVALYGAARAEQQLKMPVSVPDLMDWRAASRAFEQMEGYDLGRPGARVRGIDETVQSRCSAVTEGFLEMLGVQAVRGRIFAPDDFTPGAPPVALISYQLWQGVFGGALDALGRPVGIGAGQHTIVGVLPPSFVFPDPGRRFAPEVLVPLEVAGRTDRSSRILYVIGKLAAGVPLEQAQTEIDGIALSLKPLFVARPNVIPGAFDGATLIDLRHNMTRDSSRALWLVFAAVSVVFLIACVNVVGLLLAHGEDRRREFAVRSAIGAGRATLVRQLLIEAALLALMGASAGWFLSVAAVRLITTQLPRWLQLMGEPRLDARAAIFAAGLALVTLIVAGIIPALRASAEPPRAALAAGTRLAGVGRRGRHALIFLEVALATLLLSAGSVMLRSWMVLHAQETGMDSARVIALRSIPAGTPDASRRARHNTMVADALRRIPGVESVAFVDMPLLQKAIKGSGFIPPARVPHPAGMDTDVMVTPGYFETMGLVRHLGRSLAPEDLGRGVVISEALATRYWPGRSPVGEIISYRDGTREIVGVVSDARDVSLDRAPTPTLYHVWDEKASPIATIVIRFAGAAPTIIGEIRRAVRGVDEEAAITMLSLVDDLLSVSVAERNFNTLLFAIFAGAGLLVALVGIYGLVAFVVARREREMGIRLALGANGRGLQLFVMLGTLRWVAAGLATGISAALLGARYLKPFVYQVPANDPVALALVAGIFLVVSATATYVPARRAARVDPMIALRSE